MKFIKPKPKQEAKPDWRVSRRTANVVKYYAQFTGYNENEVVDTFLINLLKDEDFKAWIQSQRRNKRMLEQLYPSGMEEIDFDDFEADRDE
jgi:hypothetical protein